MLGSLFCALGKAFGYQCPSQSDITKPDITFYELDSSIVLSELKEMGLTILRGGLLDRKYYYTTLWGIKEAVKYVRKVYPFPKYQAEKTDCDDFAILMKGLLSAEFGINDVGINFGDSPMGYHAFNVARIEDRRVIIEPQTGEVFEIGERGYIPREVLQ